MNDQVQALGATLVALSPSTQENAAAVASKVNLSIDVLSDPENRFAEKLGLVFALPADLKAVYDGFGIDLPKFNGDTSWTLPIPGRFVVDQQGVIRYAEADADYEKRPEPEETLAALRAITG